MYDIQLKRLLHSETEDKIGPIDVHIATEMRYGESGIENEKFNVVTLIEMSMAMNHGDGIVGCIGEMFYIYTKCEQYGKG